MAPAHALWLAAILGCMAACSSGGSSGGPSGTGGTGGAGGGGGTGGSAGLDHEPEWLFYENTLVNALDVMVSPEKYWQSVPLGRGPAMWAPNRSALVIGNYDDIYKTRSWTVIDFSSKSPGDKTLFSINNASVSWAPSSERLLFLDEQSSAYSLDARDVAAPDQQLTYESGAELVSGAFAPKSDAYALLARPTAGAPYDLALIDLRQTPATRTVVAQNSGPFGWAWSPSDDLLATNVPEIEILALTASGLGAAVPVGLAEPGSIRWWPDGSGLVVQTQNGIRSVDVSAGVPSAPVSVVDDTGIPTEQFSLSPDGRWVLYLLAPGFVYPSQATGEVWITRRGTSSFSAPELLLPSFTFDGNSRPFGPGPQKFWWSPDGKNLLYLDASDTLYWVDTTNSTLGTPVSVAQSPRVAVFSSDGTRLAFTTSAGVYVIKIPFDSTVTQVGEIGANQFSNIVTWSSTGKLAYVISGNNSGLLYVVKDVDKPSTPVQVNAIGAVKQAWW